MAKLSDYQDLLHADATIDYSKLDEQFWLAVSAMRVENAERFEKERMSLIPTHEEMHRRTTL